VPRIRIIAIKLHARGYKYKLEMMQVRKSATDSPKPYHCGKNFIRQYSIVLRYAEIYILLLFSMGVKLGLSQ
jgi:hypothetical protein